MAIIRSLRLYVCYYCLWCAVSWLLVVGGQVQDSRLCVQDEGCCTTGSVMRCMRIEGYVFGIQEEFYVGLF